MKLLYLELEEEITSVIDKVRKVSDTEVTLVVPKRANLIQSIVNLKLLKKHAAMQGKTVTIVTGDPVGVNLAKRAGLEAQQRVEHGEEEESTKSVVPAAMAGAAAVPAKMRVRSYKQIQKSGVGIKKPVQTSSGKAKLEKSKLGKTGSVNLVSGKKIGIILIIILVILVAAAIAVYFYLPKATIHIGLKAEEITNDVPVTISESATEADSGDNVIPGEIYEVELTEEIEAETTGEKDAGRKAQGTVTIYNYYQTTPRVLVPSRFQSADGKIFRSTQEVTLPGYTDTGGDNKTPGTVTVTVEADEPGEEFNIEATKFTLPALPAELRSQIYAESSSAMVGGNSKKIKVVSQEDLEKAEEELLKKLRTKAESEFDKEEMVIIPEGASIEMIDYKPTPAKGEEAEKFRLEIKAKLKFLAFREDDMKKVTEDDIQGVLPADKFLLGKEEGSVSYDVKEERINDGELEVYYHASKSYARSVDKDQVKNEVVGLTEEEIVDLLSEKEAVADVSVDFWPFWVKKAPDSPDRIFIDILLE